MLLRTEQSNIAGQADLGYKSVCGKSVHLESSFNGLRAD